MYSMRLQRILAFTRYLHHTNNPALLLTPVFNGVAGARLHSLAGRTPPSRALHLGTVLLKQKGGKQDAKRTVERAQGTADAAGNDPNDFSQLESQLTRAHEHMKTNLSKLRAGGPVNIELIESLNVQLGKERENFVKVGDLAQVIPKGGRQILVLISDQVHVKPITKSIQSSPYSLNPQPNSNNPLELQISIPAPTAESRKQVLADADKAGEQTYHTIRQARGAQQKKLNAMEKARTVRPDDLHRARANMEKVVEAANKEVKLALEKAKKALQG